MEDLVPKVQKAFESAFGIDQERVTVDSTPSDIPARDSMGHVELASSLEGSGYGQKSDTPKSFARRVCNRLLHQLARSLPGASSLRPFLHRLRGVKIHGKVYIGDDVYLENEYPECIEIHDEVQIGLRTTVIAHTRGPGTIVFGKKAFVGANCVIAASPGKTLTIGEGSVLAIASLVTNDIPPSTLYGGEKAKPIARATVPFTDETSYEEFMSGLRPLETNRKTSPEHRES